jgi:hypothetical protein
MKAWILISASILLHYCNSRAKSPRPKCFAPAKSPHKPTEGSGGVCSVRPKRMQNYMCLICLRRHCIAYMPECQEGFNHAFLILTHGPTHGTRTLAEYQPTRTLANNSSFVPTHSVHCTTFATNWNSTQPL